MHLTPPGSEELPCFMPNDKTFRTQEVDWDVFIPDNVMHQVNNYYNHL
jgi:hypothetical protein